MARRLQRGMMGRGASSVCRHGEDGLKGEGGERDEASPFIQ